MVGSQSVQALEEGGGEREFDCTHALWFHNLGVEGTEIYNNEGWRQAEN